MKMKLQVFLALVIALTSLLAACGGDTPSTPANATIPAVAANITIHAGETTGAGAASPTAEPPTMLATASPAVQTPSVATEAALLEGQALVDLLRRGGHVIFFRHAATDRSQTDSDVQNLENCQTQRNLSEQGRSDARAIGQAFQELGIPVGQVLASPYCRTLETAQLAFERVESSRELLPTLSAENNARRQELVAKLRRLLSTPPATGVNTILVSHQFNLQDAASVSIAEGEAAVFEPVGANGFRLVARVPPNTWATLV